MNPRPIAESLPATFMDCASYVLLAATDRTLGATLDFGAPLDSALLARAVRLTMDRQPVLGSRFVEGPSACRWERIAGLDDELPFAVLRSAGPADTIGECLVEPIDPGAQPQVRVTLVRGATGDRICVKLSHVAGDGQATKEYCYLLADTYSRLVADPGWRPEPDRRPRPGGKEMWRRMTPVQRMRSLRSSPFKIPTWKVPCIGVSGREPTYASVEAGPERFGATRAYGRRQDATVNDLLIAAFFRALCTVLQPPRGAPAPVMVTADLRRYLNGEAPGVIFGLSTPAVLALTPDPSDGFDETLTKVTAVTRAWKALEFGAGTQYLGSLMMGMDFPLLRSLMEFAFRDGVARETSSPALSNIGVFDGKRLGFGDLRPLAARFHGPVAYGPGILPAASSYDGTLTISMGFCRSDLDEGLVRAMLGEMERELPGQAADARQADESPALEAV